MKLSWDSFHIKHLYFYSNIIVSVKNLIKIRRLIDICTYFYTSRKINIIEKNFFNRFLMIHNASSLTPTVAELTPLTPFYFENQVVMVISLYSLQEGRLRPCSCLCRYSFVPPRTAAQELQFMYNRKAAGKCKDLLKGSNLVCLC